MKRLKISWIFIRQKHFMSRIYRPANVTPPGQPPQSPKQKEKKSSSSQSTESNSISARLFLDNGIVRPSSFHGSYHLLPIGQRSLDKLIRIVDHFMDQVNCQKIQMPTLTSTHLWKTTGRLEDCGSELMKVTDRNFKSYLLSPTHEEAICDLIKCHPLSYRQMPLRLYQITDKFRDEMRPRAGLMRSRQFLMKDLYTFDIDLEASQITYQEISTVYGKLFDHLNLKWVKALGASGTMGGNMSHEFHLISNAGEDTLLHCADCNDCFNEEMAQEGLSQMMTAQGGLSAGSISKSNLKCISCGSSNLSESTSIEVAHAFLLGKKYTEPFEAKGIHEDGSSKPIEMGCYGIGMTRLVASAVEVNSKGNEIRWPTAIAPYLVIILPPKTGSKEEFLGKRMAERFEQNLDNMFGNDVLIDDRVDLTLGKRLVDAKKLGIPYIAVFGKSITSTPPLIELHNLQDGQVTLMSDKELYSFLYDVKSSIDLKIK